MNKLLVLLRRKAKSPEYTRQQWIMKGAQIYICAVGMDLSGAKLYWYEAELHYNRMTPQEAYGPYYAYLCGIHGLLIALALWRLLEMYWWGKDHVEKLRSLDCEGEVITLHKSIDGIMTEHIEPEPR